MTVTSIMAGPLSIRWRTGTGSQVIFRLIAPVKVGASSTVLTVGVMSALHVLVKQWKLRHAIRWVPAALPNVQPTASKAK